MDITKILEAILALAAAVITYIVVPWIKARTTNEQQETVRAAIRVGVYAAEQIYGAGKGAEKMAYVKRMLEGYGYEVDTAEIEAAVMQLINGTKLLFEAAPAVDKPAE